MARRRDEDEDDDGHRLIEEQEDDDDARPIMDSEDEDDLSLDEILHLYKQPINEEQAWAVCYQCCRSFLEDSAGTGGAGHVRIHKDGSVRFHSRDRSGDKSTPSASITHTSACAFPYIGLIGVNCHGFGCKCFETAIDIVAFISVLHYKICTVLHASS